MSNKRRLMMIRLMATLRSVMVALMVSIFIVAMLMSNYRPYRSGAEQVGKPVRIEDESVPVLGEMTSVLADENRLYLIWEKAMVVRVYDWNGTYLYSWWIPYEHRSDAIISVWAQAGEVYINTKACMLYHMVNDAFVDAQESHVGTPGLEFTRSVLPAWPVDRRSIAVEDVSFELRGADVYRIDGETAIKVVDRPDVFAFLTWKALWVVGLVCIILVGVLRYQLYRLSRR